MNRAELLYIFASEMKEINNIDRPDQPAWRQTLNSLGIIATPIPTNNFFLGYMLGCHHCMTKKKCGGMEIDGHTPV